MPTNLMGVDVGFSKTRRTTGIACLEGDHRTLERAGTAWESREARIPKGFQPSIGKRDFFSSPLSNQAHDGPTVITGTSVKRLNRALARPNTTGRSDNRTRNPGLINRHSTIRAFVSRKRFGFPLRPGHESRDEKRKAGPFIPITMPTNLMTIELGFRQPDR